MIEWREAGIVLSNRRHGETSAIIEVLTAEHGRHAGIVRGGISRKIAPILQPGTQLDLTWKARLEDHLGSFTVEPVKSRAVTLMSDRSTLAALNALTATLAFALPEREAQPDLYRRTIALLDMMEVEPFWPLAYLRWELALLEELGFGLDLTTCAATGTTDDLTYISPRTGRAISEAGAGVWKDRLLPLSPALVGQGDGSVGEVVDGLRVTGHFFDTWLAPSLGEKPMPEARQRFVDRLARSTSGAA